MKICTDACILGAWAADKIQQFHSIENILDIGCGTGLLSLMLAQKTTAKIDAIEINADAAGQAKENVLQSQWIDSIEIINTSLQHFHAIKKYDLIISNPPFFEDDLKSGDENKNASKHDVTLKFEELISFIKQNLAADGHAVVLIPHHRTEYFSSLVAENNLFIHEALFLKQSPAHKYFRSILLFSNKNIQPVESNELVIHDAERNYTEGFKELLGSYYLKL
jgi:tRNA1Val (adenine37-N6)-methyltransferase